VNARGAKTLICVSCFALVLVSLEAEAADARAWLERMNRAVEDLNYEGTYVHLFDGNAETMYIVHRNHNGEIGERYVSLDGAGREVIGREDQLQVIFPDRHIVLLKKRKKGDSLSDAFPSYSSELETHYQFKLSRTARVANRSAQIIVIKPKDQYRYGYVLWLDQDTAYPLKLQLRDERGRTLEQILFTQIEISDFIPASALNPTIDTQGFMFYRSPEMATQAVADVPWHVSMLPGGFRLSIATQSPIGGSKYTVEQLVYSDGLASVSVFIEDPKTHPDVADGFSHVGSFNAFSLTLAGRKVTAMGEVPKLTVHAIATSLSAQ
jgi:sigma-E factor negative regulatory protein RseB